jgi:hypothetical protein
MDLRSERIVEPAASFPHGAVISAPEVSAFVSAISRPPKTEW